MKRVPLLRKKFYVYLLKELLLLFFLSLAVFTFILVLSNLGKLADQVVNKGVGLGDILLLIVFSSPKFLTFTLPMAFLLSSVVALGRLSSENEILALKASGINLRYLFVPIATLGLAVLLAGFLNSSLLLSKSSRAFHDTLANIITKGFSIEDKEGIFNDSIKGVVIYIDKVDAKKRSLSGIVISDDRDEACPHHGDRGEGERSTLTPIPSTCPFSSRTVVFSNGKNPRTHTGASLSRTTLSCSTLVLFFPRSGGNGPMKWTSRSCRRLFLRQRPKTSTI